MSGTIMVKIIFFSIFAVHLCTFLYPTTMRERSNSSFMTIPFLFILFLLGLVLSSPVVKAQDSMYEVQQDYEYYGMDMRAEHSYYPDKEKHIRGLDLVKISISNEHILLYISDSLFVADTLPYLSVIVEDGVASDMPVASVKLKTKQTHLSIPVLIGDKDYVRVVVWIDNFGDNDAKRVLEIRRKTKRIRNTTTDNFHRIDEDNDSVSIKKALAMGKKFIQVAIVKNDLVLNISDSIFLNTSFPFLSVGVQHGTVSDMPILGELLNEAGELRLNLPLLMHELDSARIAIWVDNTGDYDAEKIVTVFRNEDGKTFNIPEQQ